MQLPTGGFDASTIAPEQGGSKHPTGTFPFQITSTDIVSSKDETSGMFVVEFSSPAGTIDKRYSLWHSNPQVVEIANKQLSALCHATGVFKLNWQNKGAELRGAMGTMDVADQIDKTTKQPNGYVEVKKVYDKAGNEPGKANVAPQVQQPVQQQQPAQAAGGGWGNAAAQTAAPAAPAANSGWGQAAPQQQQPAPMPTNSPPWAR